MSEKMWPLAKNRSSLPSRSASKKAVPQPMRLNVGPAMPADVARVLEVPAVDVVIERVAIVRECREHQIHPRVAVVVAGVGAHARLGARVAVHRHARGQSRAFEAAVPEVVIQEIRVRVVRDEHVDEPVVVVVGRHDAEAVGLGRVGQAVRGGGLHEPSVADVLEEQIRTLREVRPGLTMMCGPSRQTERPLRPHDRIPRRLDVARDVEVQIAVAVGIEERAPRAPAAGGHAGAGSHLLERAVATVAEQRVRSPVGDVEIEAAVAVEIAGARAAAPRREIHARLPGHVLELPSPEVAIEGIAMWDTLTRRRELRPVTR